MNERFVFETEPFELDLERDESEEEQPDAYSEFDGEWLARVSVPPDFGRAVP